jgi:3-hydroxy-9,10-secoandrosta-1,3,5(10)-triene-9,17-dione monooxygenase reductase component
MAGVATEVLRQQFRSVIGHFATGVAVITGSGADGPAGMTTNAVASLSLDPLLVLVCFEQSSRTLEAVRATGRFGVNVLESAQEPIARVFATKLPAREKFEGVGYALENEVPILDGALAWLACDLETLVPGGDHAIAIGTVQAMHQGEGEPLVFYRGGYRELD